MARLTEIALILLPFALFIAWRLAGGGRAVPGSVVAASGLSVAAAALLLAALGFGWFGIGQILPRNAAYVPARVGTGGAVIGPDGGR